MIFYQPIGPADIAAIDGLHLGFSFSNWGDDQEI
jgi:hypothetical protein